MIQIYVPIINIENYFCKVKWKWEKDEDKNITFV